MKIVSVVGARPEFIQAAPVSRALRERHQEILVHTGQHYDYAMSQAFFDELGIPTPDYNLEVGSAPHGKQTGEMLSGLERVLMAEKPDLALVRGDTNSTLAGALAASKLHIPVAHIEAGERSYDRRMPEELNRLVTDCLSDVHFCVSQTAVQHLDAEGIRRSVYWVGDVMLDAITQNLIIARQKSSILDELALRPGRYALATVHRASNTDDPNRLAQIMQALNAVDEPLIFPVHPRTAQVLDEHGIQAGPQVRQLAPVGYFDMLILEENARLIATDSGGVQREAYFLGVPCLTLRDETEWVETITAGWNELVGCDPERILGAWRNFAPPAQRPPIFGDGRAAGRIAQTLTSGPLKRDTL